MTPAISAREWRRVLVLALALAALTSIPYVLGWLRSDATHIYSGATLDLMDYNSYLAKMQQGAAGQWRFTITYTSEEHAGGFVYPFYLLLGHIAGWTGLSLPLVYQLARLLCALGMVAAIYRLMAALLAAPAWRWIACLLACAGGGLGWLQLLIAPTAVGGISPIDFWLMDGFPYFSALTFPHFTAAVALMALALAGFLALLRATRASALAGAALCMFSLTLIHPFGGGLTFLIAGLYGALALAQRRTNLRRALPAGLALALPAAPILGYDAWLFSTQPAFRAWAAQNITLSPPPGHYLASYGLLLALAVAGLTWALPQRGPLWLAGAWLLAVALLVYAPTNLQRRFLEGVMVPLGALATVGATLLLRRIRARAWRRRAWLLLVALTWPSNLALTAGVSAAALARSPSLFYPGDLIAAVDWVGANAGPETVVFSALETGNLIPARTGRRVYLGHWIETQDYARKREEVSAFFAGALTEAAQRALLRAGHITHVFHGPAERALGGFEPARAAYLEPAFCAGDVVLYRVREP